MDEIYLDHHSTTPCDPRVVERMIPFFTHRFGNPAAVTHAHGRDAAHALEEARGEVASFLGVSPREIYFTSGATESNNLVIQGSAPRHLVTTAIEHKSVLAPAALLVECGLGATSIVTPDHQGFVEPAAVERAIRAETELVSVLAASGDIGTIEPVGEIADLCRDRKVPFHTDATQAVGRVPIDARRFDFLSLSGHKFYGPKGIGALYMRSGCRLRSVTAGGGQERNLRSGTVNVAGAVGLAAALSLRSLEMEAEAERLTELRNRLWDRLIGELRGVSVQGPRELRLPGNLNVRFEGVDAESLIHALRRFSLSSGSACSSGDREPSPVLMAIGLDERQALGALRIGMGKSTTDGEVGLLVEDIKRSVPRLREMSADWSAERSI